MAEKPKAYFQTDVPSDDRFISLDKPTQQEFTNLFDSLRFGAETADSAKTNRHGLIKVATKTLKNARSNTDASGFTVAVVPDQLPEVVAAGGATITVSADNTLERTVYTIDDSALVALISTVVTANVGAWVNISPAVAPYGDDEYGEDYANVGASSALRYRTVPSGIQVSGAIRKQGSLNRDIAFRLQAAVRPSRDVVSPIVIIDNYGSVLKHGYVYINTAGEAKIAAYSVAGVGLIGQSDIAFLDFIYPL